MDEDQKDYLWMNRRTNEIRVFPYSYEEGLPVGGPEDGEGNPLWVPIDQRVREALERGTVD